MDQTTCTNCDSPNLDFLPMNIRLLTCADCGANHTWSLEPIRYEVTPEGMAALK